MISERLFAQKKTTLGCLSVQLINASDFIRRRCLNQDINTREKPVGYLLGRILKRSAMESRKTEHHGHEIRMQKFGGSLNEIFYRCLSVAVLQQKENHCCIS